MESEFILSKNDIVMSELSEFTEIPSSGFNRLFKVKRYGQWFVLKTLKEEYSAETIYQQLLKKEFEIGIQLNHPNVVRYMSFEPNTRYGAGILMEYIDGMTLSEYIHENSAKPNNQHDKICNELLHALNYLHHLQLTHRDLKPQNIIITHNGANVKVIDFGLSDADHYSVFKLVTGSAGYSSPEQKTEDTTVDCRSDIYSLGKILLELFPNTKSDMHRIACKCINPNPHKRYANINEIFAAINKLKLRKRAYLTICLLMSLSAIIIASLYYINLNHSKEKEQLIEEYSKKAEMQNDSIYAIMQNRLDSAEINNKELSKITEREELKRYYTDTIKLIYSREFSILENLIEKNPNYLYEDLQVEYLKLNRRVLSDNFLKDLKNNAPNEDILQHISECNLYFNRQFQTNIQTRMGKIPKLSDLLENGEISSEEYKKRDSLYYESLKQLNFGL